MMQTILAWKCCGVAYQHQHCSARSVAAGTAKISVPPGGAKRDRFVVYGGIKHLGASLTPNRFKGRRGEVSWFALLLQSLEGLGRAGQTPGVWGKVVPSPCVTNVLSQDGSWGAVPAPFPCRELSGMSPRRGQLLKDAEI